MSSEPQLPQKPGPQRDADVYDLLAWLETNWQKVAAAGVVVVLIGFGIATMRYMNQQKELKASAALLALKPALTPSTNNPANPPSAFLKVAEDFSGTAAAERAQFLAATTFFTEGKYAEAEAAFSRFVQGHSGSPWVASAAFGVAAAQEAQNKANEAQASYQNVATAYANSPVADDAKLALARIHEAKNQPEQALRLYNELLATPPGAAPGQFENPEARARKDALLRAHPQLDTNTAAAATLPLPQLSAPAANTLSVTNTAAGTNQPNPQ